MPEFAKKISEDDQNILVEKSYALESIEEGNELKYAEESAGKKREYNMIEHIEKMEEKLVQK